MLRRNSNFILLTIAFDLGSVLAAILLTEWLRLNLPYGLPITAGPGIPVLRLEALVVYPLVFLLLSLYDPERTFRAVDEYQILTVTCLVAALTLAGLVYFTLLQKTGLARFDPDRTNHPGEELRYG